MELYKFSGYRGFEGSMNTNELIMKCWAKGTPNFWPSGSPKEIDNWPKQLLSLMKDIMKGGWIKIFKNKS